MGDTKIEATRRRYRADLVVFVPYAPRVAGRRLPKKAVKKKTLGFGFALFAEN